MPLAKDSSPGNDECPPWCIATDHLNFRLMHGMSDYSHTSAPSEALTTDLTHNWDPVSVEVYLTQQMHHVRDLEYVRYPAEILIHDGFTVTPAQARHYATLLVEMAGRAEAEPFDAIPPPT